MSLADELASASAKLASPPSKDFRPGVVYAGSYPSEITTDALPDLGDDQEKWSAAVKAMGVPLPEGSHLELIAAEYVMSHNEAAWHRDPQDRREKDTAYTAPNDIHRWRYKFRVVAGPLFKLADLEKALVAARKAVRGRPVKPASDKVSMIVNLSDFQIGKSDILGGTPELLERSEAAMALVIAQIRKQKPIELILVDNGDSTEGFNSAPNAARVNDLQETEALYVWQEMFWRWIKTLAALVEIMKTISVPSNHCANRKGKDRLGPISDDWGLLTLRQLAKRAEENPEAYGHIQFMIPREHEKHVTITLAGGKVVSFLHGEDAGNPNALVDWAKGKAPRDVVFSDMLVVGHFHHLRWISYGDKQWLIICPTMDPGSSHYTVRAREASDPGVLTFVVDETGWRDLFVAWA